VTILMLLILPLLGLAVIYAGMGMWLGSVISLVIAAIIWIVIRYWSAINRNYWNDH